MTDEIFECINHSKGVSAFTWYELSGTASLLITALFLNFLMVYKMIRCKNQLRLTNEEIDLLFKLTGTLPKNIHTVNELNSFVDSHIPNFEDSTPESKLLKMLLSDCKVQHE